MKHLHQCAASSFEFVKIVVNGNFLKRIVTDETKY
jgi:hypothetical protein